MTPGVEVGAMVAAVEETFPVELVPVAACGWREGTRVHWLPLAHERWFPGSADGLQPAPGQTLERKVGTSVLRVTALGPQHQLLVLLGSQGYHPPLGHRAVLAAIWAGRLRYGRVGSLPPVDVSRVPLLDAPLTSAADIVDARQRLQALLLGQGLVAAGDLRPCVASTEAMVNAVRHGGGGRVHAVRTAHGLEVRVEDAGPGIDFDRLARALLVPRDAASLGRGHGFWLMLAYARACWIWTGRGGTRVVLRFAGTPAATGAA